MSAPPLFPPQLLRDLDDVSGTYAEVKRDDERSALRKEVQRISQGAPQAQQTPDQIAQEEDGGFSDTLRAIASDVAKGTFKESARAVSRGVLDLGADTLEAMADFNDSIRASGFKDSDDLIEALGVKQPPFVQDKTASFKAGAEKIEGVIGPPESVTGKSIEEFTNFIGAFVGFSKKLKAATVLAGESRKALLARGAVAGSLAGALTMDPIESLLDGFLESNPDLRGPVESFLAGDPDDNRMVGRLRNGLLDAGFGVLTDLGVIGFRALRASRAARKTKKTLADLEEFGITDEVLEGGSREGPRIQSEAPDVTPRGQKKQAQNLEQTIRDVQAEVEARFGPDHGFTSEEIAAQAADDIGRVNVNFRAIRSAEDVTALLKDAAELFAERIDKARRGRVSQIETARLADEAGLTPEELGKRPVGQSGNAHEVQAARHLRGQLSDELNRLSDEVLGQIQKTGHADQASLYQLRRHGLVFQAIDEQVFGLRAEAGRALNSFNITIKGDVERARFMSNMLNAMGGEETAEQLARLIGKAKDKGIHPGQLAKFLEKGVLARTSDALSEHFVNGLLWSPKTHIVNTVSPYMIAAQQIPERFMAEKIGQVLGRGSGEGVAPGEAMALAYGFARGIDTLLTEGGRGLKNEKGLRRLKGAIDAISEARAETGLARRGKTDESLDAISSVAFGRDPNGAVGRAADFYGSFTRTPGTALAIEDDMGKILGYSAEVYARAYRQAFSEGGTNAQIWDRVHALVSDPPRDIRLAAQESALYFTYQNEIGVIGKAATALRRAPGMFYFIPFVRTPINIMNYAFERTALAPLSGRWQSMIKQGGAQADIAAARASLGVLTMSAFLDMSYAGLLHGDGPRAIESQGTRSALRRSGWKPNSAQIGDKIFEFTRLDAIGLQASFAATLGERIRALELEDEDVPGVMEVFAAGSVAAMESSMSRSWVTGIARLHDAIRYGGSRERFLGRTVATAFMPASSLFKTFTEATDPTLSDPAGAWENVQAMIPIWERGLSRRLTLTGHPIESQEVYGRTADVLSPIRFGKLEASPFDREVIENDMDLRDIRRKTKFRGVDVNFREFPRVKEAYTKMAGHGFERNGQGFEAWANELVQSTAYLQQPVERRRERLSVGMFKFRESAQRDLLKRIDRGDYSGPMAEFEPHREQFDAFAVEYDRLRERSRQPIELQSGAEVAVERERKRTTLPRIQ